MTELEKELTIKVKRLEDDCKAYNFTQHTLQEKIKELEALNEKMKCCRICVSYDDLAISDWSPCKTCKNKSNWEFAE